jgi:ThiF family protein/E2/UBC family protein B
VPNDSTEIEAGAEGEGSAAGAFPEARALAERTLEDAGFTRSGNDWIGGLRVDETTIVQARLSLPERFPDALPEIKVDRKTLPRRIPHVEENGKICIAPSSGVLIDADRPADVLLRSLELAEEVLRKGLSGASERDFQIEFLAYWKPTDQRTTYSICKERGGFREVILSRVTGEGFLKPGQIVVSDSEEDVARWSSNLGATHVRIDKAVLVPLESPFAPPDFDVATTVGNVREVLREHASPKDVASFERWLESAQFPTTILLSLPEAIKNTGRILIGVRIEKPAKDIQKTVHAGFRPGHLPAWRTLGFLRNALATRLKLTRLDRNYLGIRGGAAQAISGKRVVLVGAGAVGSEVAGMLAAAGVEELRVIDPETLSADNVHRHVLGVRDLDNSKALALTSQLRARFPHLAFEARQDCIEGLLRQDSQFVTDVDLILIALGDETIERRLNQLLAGRVPRIHAWVEPLGVGGHALACGLSGPGCFECLFRHDQKGAIGNTAAFVEPGQLIQRSLAGCAGTFSPFSAFDARRTALEASNLAVSVLSGDQKETVLVSWRGDRKDFENLGYRLSARGADTKHGARVFLTSRDLARKECSVCGTRRNP